MAETGLDGQIPTVTTPTEKFIVASETFTVAPPTERKADELTLTDVSTPEGLNQLKNKISVSKGKCFVLVHPFFGLKRQEDFQKPLVLPPNEEYKKYIGEVVGLLKNFSNNQIPVLIVEDGVRGLQRRDNLKGVEATKSWLQKELAELANLNSGEVFYVVSEQGSPSPLVSNAEDEKYRDMQEKGALDFKSNRVKVIRQPIIDFVNKLKGAGLAKAYIAGSNLGGYYSFGPEYLPADSGLSEGEFMETVGVLKDHFAKRRDGKEPKAGIKQHPFETILPRGCVAEMMRAIAYCDIDVLPTGATYPQKTPAREQIVKTKNDVYEMKPR